MPVVIDSGRDGDRIVIELNRGAAPDLAGSGQYRLRFHTSAPTQDRNIHDESKNAVVRCFNTSDANAAVATGRDTSHVFTAWDTPGFGPFRLTNAQNPWPVNAISP